MKSYQSFVGYYNLLRRQFEDTALDDIDIHIKDREDFYKKAGIEGEDAIRQYEIRKSREMHDNIQTALGMAHVIEIEEPIKRYLILNTPPKTPSFYNKAVLPFRSVFLDVEISDSDSDISASKIIGMLITETPLISHSEDSKGLKFEILGRGYRVHYLCLEDGRFFIDEFKILLGNDKIPIFYDDKKTARFVKEFVMNLLVFVNDPEIHFIDRLRSQKNIQRRAKQGKPALPSSKMIRLTGVLRRYISSISGSLGRCGSKYSHRFWVRGHMRYLSSDRYKQKKGQWIKIEPFIKGEGVLVKRIYRVTDDKEDDRIKELKDSNLFFDDIEPLKKPLHEIMEKRRGCGRGDKA